MRKGLTLWWWLASVLVLLGCAQQPPVLDTRDLHEVNAHWSGRLSLRVADDPSQSWAVGFDLRGNVQAGELWLTGPLGSAVAHAQWGPDGAVLIQGQDRRSFTGVDRLWLDLTGIDDLPASVLFAYLQGQASVVPEGWEVNGPRPGRIQLHRMAAAQRPAVRVDILLD